MSDNIYKLLDKSKTIGKLIVMIFLSFLNRNNNAYLHFNALEINPRGDYG